MREKAVLGVLCAALVAGCGGPGGRFGRGGGDESGFGAKTTVCRAPFDEIHGQLSETARLLELTPKQTVLWENYATSVGALISDQVRHEVQVLSKPTALQQINAKTEVVRNRLAAMEEITARARALYASLDNGQKKIADQRLAGTIPTLSSSPNCGGAEGAAESDAGGRARRGGSSGEMGRY